MADQPAIITSGRDSHDNALEASARIAIMFVVRAVLLPVTLPRTKPSELACAASGDCRPLPSPFLLALIAGVAVSGAVSGISVFWWSTKSFTGALNEYIATIGRFYAETTDSIEAILFAIPYVFVLWLAAGLVSLITLRGARGSEAIFTATSLCLAALIEVFALLFALISFTPLSRMIGVEYVLLAGVLVYAGVLTTKLAHTVRIIGDGASRKRIAWGAAPCLALVILLGLVGAGLLWGTVNQQRQEADDKLKLAAAASHAPAPAPQPTPEADPGADAFKPPEPSESAPPPQADRANPTPVILSPDFAS